MNAPSTSNSTTPTETQSSIIPQDVRDDNLDMEVAHMGSDPLFGIPILEVTSEQSTTPASPQAIMQTNHPLPHHNSKWTKDHPLNNIIGQLSRPPKTYKEALTQSCWIEAMLEELHEFVRLENKAHLVARGCCQEEGIDFEESQPDGFVDLDNPNHVYKLKKALYGLKQAPRAWYDMLSSFLLSQDFSKGSVDPTLFIRKNVNDLLLVQIYVDDIIFAAHTLELCDLFANLMCSKFKMSMMGKISFFLGLQISQNSRGIFINQSKYALESLKKYGFESCDPVDTPMVEKSKLDEYKEGKAVDPSHYRGMIGTLLYLTASRPDLQFAICMCARYQAQPTEKHVHALLQMRITLVDKILAGVHLEVCNFWERRLLADYGLAFNKIPMYCDNKSAIALCCNNVQHSRSKHIDIRYHFIKEHVENGVIELYFVNTKYQLADLFTKALGRDRIEFLNNKLGMRSFTPETLIKLMNDEDE
nr:hypothetical protein [Tanacetum cinerariifolium]